jgi:pimeloyl-ACP methyl ester carboxylesterase
MRALRPLVLQQLAQYLGLMQRLARCFRVVAADLYGHGRSPSWPQERRFTLADEAAPLEALLPDDAPAHLVGHSYGAAVALRIAGANRVRVRSMALYEPAIWGTLSHLCPGDPAALEIEAVRDETIRLIDSGRLEAATERFIDYWSGSGTWAGIPEDRRPRLVAAVRSLRAAWIATFVERWSTEALRSLDTSCLLLTAHASRSLRVAQSICCAARCRPYRWSSSTVSATLVRSRIRNAWTRPSKRSFLRRQADARGCMPDGLVGRHRAPCSRRECRTPEGTGLPLTPLAVAGEMAACNVCRRPV